MGARSFTTTTSMSERSKHKRVKYRPILPNPFSPSLNFSAMISLVGCAAKINQKKGIAIVNEIKKPICHLTNRFLFLWYLKSMIYLYKSLFGEFFSAFQFGFDHVEIRSFIHQITTFGFSVPTTCGISVFVDEISPAIQNCTLKRFNAFVFDEEDIVAIQ